MAQKDPAFLFYSKDWISGTSEMLPEEKGVYIDLLCYQHQNGNLPDETKRLCRIVGLNHDDFLRIWETLKSKFVAIAITNDGANAITNAPPNAKRLVNQKLCDVMQERSEKGWRNTISGTFSSVLRKAKLFGEEYTIVRKAFKIEDFLNFNKEELSERISEWLSERLSERSLLCLKSIGNGNANGNGDGDANKEILILDKKNSKKFKIPSLEEFKKYFEENGFDLRVAERAWKGYDAAEWHDTSGKKILNWKQKCQNVWFKPENEKSKTPQIKINPAHDLDMKIAGSDVMDRTRAAAIEMKKRLELEKQQQAS